MILSAVIGASVPVTASLLGNGETVHFGCECRRTLFRELLANMGRPLLDSACWLRLGLRPSAREKRVLDTKYVGYNPVRRRAPEYRPWTITKSPSATTLPGSYFRVGGRLLMRLNILTSRCDVRTCWMCGDQNFSAAG